MAPAKKIAVERDVLSINSGKQLIIKDKLKSENSKHANSAGEQSCNNNTSGSDDERRAVPNCELDEVCKIKVSSSSSIEISKVYVPSSNIAKLVPSKNTFLEKKIENKIIQNVCKQEVSCQRRLMSHITQDSGMSSCQESSQEFPTSQSVSEGFLVRSSSSGSARSFDSQSDFPASQASTHIQHDSDDETDDEILSRVEEFTLEREEKLKPQSTLYSVPVSDNQIDDVNVSNLGVCRFCMVSPKNGVFVHNNCLHLCCCYKCAVKVWKKRKSCPICNCKIKNVTKLFVH